MTLIFFYFQMRIRNYRFSDLVFPSTGEDVGDSEAEDADTAVLRSTTVCKVVKKKEWIM